MAKYSKALSSHIQHHMSDIEAGVRTRIGSGISNTFLYEQSSASISFSLDEVFAEKHQHCDMIALDCAHGVFSFSNNSEGFLALTGVPFTRDLLRSPDMFAFILSRLPAGFTEFFVWLKKSENVNDHDNAMMLRCRINFSDCALDFPVMASAKAWNSFFAVGNWAAVDVEQTHESDVALEIPCVAGRVNVYLSDWKKLTSGDVLMMDDTFFDIDGQGFVTYAGYDMHLQFAGDFPYRQFQLTRWEESMYQDNVSPVQESVASQHDETMNTTDSGEKAAISKDMLLTLSVQLGTIAMQASDINSLPEGSVITLNSPSSKHVQIFFGQQEIARGQLVDVDGKLGVQLIGRRGR